MRKIFTFLFFIISFTASAEFNIKIYYEPIENGYQVYADNMEYCPVSIKLSFTMQNMRIEGGNDKIYVVPERSSKQLLTTIRQSQKGKAYKFSYKSRYNYGDNYINNYNSEFVYNLPFSKSESFKIHQGYNGSFSHQNKKALDFTMPISTKIKAVREGTVVRVVDTNNKTCGTEDCKKYNNFITIYHSDGTFAEYVHIKEKGSLVKVGDKVEQDQDIALSGNVGFSTGPHLHLEIFLQRLEQRETIATKFKIDKGDTIIPLEESQLYLRDY